MVYGYQLRPCTAPGSGWVLPEKKTLCATERDESKRAQFLEDIAELELKDIVWLDECGAHTSLTRLYARSVKGARAIGRVPRNRGKTLTLLCALQKSGVCADLVIEGGVNGQAFVTYVREVLVPCLQPGQTVVMDNLKAHHVAPVREFIQAAGCKVLYLPPYSPDFNPIELLFSKLKAQLRALGARSKQTLTHAIGTALGTVSLKDITGWINATPWANTS